MTGWILGGILFCMFGIAFAHVTDQKMFKILFTIGHVACIGVLAMNT